MARTERTPEEVAAREYELLNIAYDIIKIDGVSALTMDRVASASPYSKGTVYKDFSGKEDMLTALCLRGLDIQLALYQRVPDFPGSSREKALALFYAYQHYAKKYPVLFRCVLDGLSSSVLEKTQEHRLVARATKEREIAAICDRVVAEALVNGDISTSTYTVAQLTFANWAMGFGTAALQMAAQKAFSVSRIELDSTLLLNASLVMDGIGWQPLYSEYDYQSVWVKIKEYFEGLPEYQVI
ncbi:TetR/AcrR family transcriptional regulator [Teredinibacter purpureus]|uniref:TetR/AcrR family transcriptional regulator n=1 Tax=Teredinibacter purpureus TaxID=2731756 RepID=UPI0005F8663C|nr:TetR/AcrR family transcriptional regulator [Teredinibacter purpureus]